MSVDLAELLKPIDWARCKSDFPFLSADLVSAINSDKTDGEERKETRKATRAAIKHLERLQVSLSKMAERDRNLAFFLSVEGYEDAAGLLQAHDGISTIGHDTPRRLAALRSGLQVIDENNAPKMGSFGKKRAREIAKPLAILFALDLGAYPKVNKSSDGSGASGYFGVILERLLAHCGENVVRLDELAGGYCKKLAELDIAQLRVEAAAQKFRDDPKTPHRLKLALMVLEDD